MERKYMHACTMPPDWLHTLHVLLLAGSGKASVLQLLLEAAGEAGPVTSPNAPHTR
jgi:hypothetical protein